MERNEILEKLTLIFRKVFKNDDLVVNENLSADDIENWDSLTNTVMIDEVENTFGFKFKFKEMINMENIGDMIDLIIKHTS